MSLPGYRDIADASELLPSASVDIKSPGIVVMIRPVSAAESNNRALAALGTTTLTLDSRCHYVALLRHDRSGKFLENGDAHV